MDRERLSIMKRHRILQRGFVCRRIAWQIEFRIRPWRWHNARRLISVQLQGIDERECL